jgi:general secretion pathway protein F
LNILSEQTNDLYFKSVIDRIAENIKMGYNFSSGLEEYGKIFSPFYRAMINAGERTGALDTALLRVSEYYKRKYELLAKVKTAIAYPILIMGVGIFTLFFIFTNVIPKILPLIQNLNTDLPLPTRILIGTSYFLKNNIHWFVFGILFFVLLGYRASGNNVLKYYFSRFKLKLPILGEIIFKSEVAQFASAAAMSIKSGIPVIQAVNISIPILKEYVIIKALNGSVAEIESGGTLGEAMKRGKIFPPIVYNLIKVGEESGDLENALNNIALSYEADCEEALKVFTNLLEPVMVMIIGIVVGFVVIAVLLPIFDMNFIGM